MSNRIRILIVDDEKRFLQTLGQRLALRDFDVTTASDGAEAVRLAKNEKFDLALVDLKMPGLGGERVLELLRAQDPLIEVVILTGHASIDSAVECTKLGAYNYLQKPCETEELLRVLSNAYQRRVQHRLQINEERLSEILSAAPGESALGILRRLRDLDDDAGK